MIRYLPPSSRLLAAAVGNTTLSFLPLTRRLFLDPIGPLPTGEPRRLNAAWKEILRSMDGVPTEAILGGVVPGVLTELERFLRAKGVRKIWRFRRNLPCPLDIRPKPAARVGDDRLAAALGALDLDPHPWVVVDCGTALTVNAVRPARGRHVGVFEGGLIMPGEALALRSLHAGTAQLPAFDALPAGTPGPAIGTSTREAMRAGVRRMQLAAIVHAAQAQAHALGPGTRLALTGGGAPYLWNHLQKELRELRPVYRPHLVLLGLFAAWARAPRAK